MPRFSLILFVAAILFTPSCQNPSPPRASLVLNAAGKPMFTATFGEVTLDGSAVDPVWEDAEWQNLDQVWVGAPPKAADCSGRYKIAWDENFLYLLVEITDDSLLDAQSEASRAFREDDGLVLFMDEDTSGGNHYYTHNAFAYHLDRNGQVTDLGPDSTLQFFDEHFLTRQIVRGTESTWEIGVRLYDGKKWQADGENVPKLLKQGKQIGFALAYIDRDGRPSCDNILGNIPIAGPNKRICWEDAGTFGILTLE